MTRYACPDGAFAAGLHDTTLYVRAADALGPGGGVVGRGAFQEAPGRDPDLELLRPRRVGGRDVLIEVPGCGGGAPGIAGGIVGPVARDAGWFEIDRARVVRDRGDCSGPAMVLLCPKLPVWADPEYVSELQIVGAHRLGRVGDDGLGILRRGAGRQERDEQGDPAECFAHVRASQSGRASASGGKWPDYTRLEVRVRLKPDATDVQVRLKPDATAVQVRLKPDATAVQGPAEAGRHRCARSG